MTETVPPHVAFIQREIEQLEAAVLASRPPPRSARRSTGGSMVFSLRLDPAEVAALEARAAMADLKPTVLARNLIRSGLAAPYRAEIAGALDRLEAVMDELRAVVT